MTNKRRHVAADILPTAVLRNMWQTCVDEVEATATTPGAQAEKYRNDMQQRADTLAVILRERGENV